MRYYEIDLSQGCTYYTKALVFPAEMIKFAESILSLHGKSSRGLSEITPVIFKIDPGSTMRLYYGITPERIVYAANITRKGGHLIFDQIGHTRILGKDFTADNLELLNEYLASVASLSELIEKSNMRKDEKSN